MIICDGLTLWKCEACEKGDLFAMVRVQEEGEEEEDSQLWRASAMRRLLVCMVRTAPPERKIPSWAIHMPNRPNRWVPGICIGIGI